MDPAEPVSSPARNEVTETWIDQKLQYLAAQFDNRARIWRLIDPLPELYGKLETGDEKDLQVVVGDLSQEIGLAVPPVASYELSLKMPSNAAGLIQGMQIKIPLSFVGKPYALGGTIAHELSHRLIAEHRIPATTIEELERLTDLTAIAVGMGKLLLNGTIAEVGFETGEIQTLGYIGPRLRAYAYRMINQWHDVDPRLARTHLTTEALGILDSVIPAG